MAYAEVQPSRSDIERERHGQSHPLCKFTLPQAVDAHKRAMEIRTEILERLVELKGLGNDADVLGGDCMETGMVNFEDMVQSAISDWFDDDWDGFKELLDSYPGEAS